jgi:hypothetical protein
MKNQIKNILLGLLLLFSFQLTKGQEVVGNTGGLEIEYVNEGVISDSIIVRGSDKVLKYVKKSVLLADYLKQVNLTAANTSLDDTDLPISPVANLQAYAESNDAAVLIARSTGVSSSYTSSVVVGGTTFAQPDLNGEISSDQGYFSISHTGATGISVNDLTAPSTFVYIDNAGNRQQQTSEPTRQDFTRKIFTMRIAVDTSTNLILGFEYLNNPIGHYANSIRDLYSFLLAQGVPFKKDQIITGRATDLGFDVSSGSFLEFGGTGDIYNPNIPPVAAVTNAPFFLSTRTGFDAGGNTALPKFWDNNGTLTALGSTTLVGHRLYRFSNGNFVLQYGQGNYANMALAKVGARLEEYVLNPALKNATFFGWWFIESTATNTGGTTLTDFIEYTIGVSGGSSNSLSGCLLKGNNLSDLLDAAAARTNLGVTALDAQNVKLTGSQAISGTKLFSDAITFSSTVAINSGSLALGSVGRIQGIDLVTDNTDATNKIFVTSLDNANVKLTGNQSIQGVKTFSEYILFIDSAKSIFGTNSDLEIFHDGSDSYIKVNSFGTGDLIIENEVADIDIKSTVGAISLLSETGISLRVNGTDIAIQMPSSGAVELRHSNVAKLTTIATGVTVTGDLGSTTLTPTALTTGTIPYKSAGALLDSSISTDGTDVTLNGSLSATDGIFSGDLAIGVANADTPLHAYSATGNVIATFESGDSDSFINIKDSNSGTYGVILGAVGDDFIVAPNFVEALKIKADLSAIFSSTVSATDEIEVTAATSATLKINSTKNGTWTDGEVLGKIDFFGNDTSGVGVGVKGNISLEANGTFGAAFDMVFKTSEGASNALEALRLNSDKSATFASSITATAFNTSSDYRLKEDLKDFSGLKMISNIPVYDYKWKADEGRSYGVMAHELQEVLPYAVTSEKDGEKMQAVDYSKIVPLLIKSIQELTAKVKILENK